MNEWLTCTFSSACGVLAGCAMMALYHRLKLGSTRELSNKILQRAESDAEVLFRDNELALKKRTLEHERELEKLRYAEKRKLQQEEERLKVREDKLDVRLSRAEKKLSDVERREAELHRCREQLEKQAKGIEVQEEKLVRELENVSQLSSSQARELLVERTSREVQRDLAQLTLRLKKEAEEDAERAAATILATAINRLSVAYVTDATVATVVLPNDEIKGRLIGREGRNIRALEQATGVNLIVDETPGVVELSAYDPVRRQVARLALNELILDGRIHPSRIEEVVEKARRTVDRQVREYGEDAMVQIGAIDLHPELVILLGKLRFRFSNGQNVLEHSLEVAAIMGLMAAELGLDVALAKRMGLLHDIGKAVSHDVDGPHALIGYDMALKLGESASVANGIGGHHQEMAPSTVEASLCGAADSLSAARPGARIEALGQYVKRLQQLESIASEFPGVDRAYALQAGRELRIAVLPDMIDDAGAVNLARDVAKKIQKQLVYPGRIKVTVIRERRCTEYAL